MVKETTIKISKVFKEVLRGYKQTDEGFEETIQRLIKGVEDNSIPKKLEKDQYTDKNKGEYTENQEEKVFTNPAAFNLEVAKRRFESSEEGIVEQEIIRKKILITSEDQYSKEERTIELDMIPSTRNLGEVIAVHDFPLPSSVQAALQEKEREINDPILNAPKIDSGIIIKQIPHDPVKQLKHQSSFL